MRIIKFITFVSSIFFLCSCTDIAVYSDYDKQVDFSKYTTYFICSEAMEVKNLNYPMYDNTFNRNYIKEGILAEMNKIGYQEVDLNPDLQVNFQIIINDKLMTIKNCSGIGVYDYWPDCRINTYDYTEGTLIIYVSDINKNQIIWQGSAMGILDVTPEKIKKVIDKTVIQIFKDYPIVVKMKKQDDDINIDTKIDEHL